MHGTLGVPPKDVADMAGIGAERAPRDESQTFNLDEL
jgi:hypothetical protein